MGDFHVNLTRDAYSSLRDYVLNELEHPIWEFFSKDVIRELKQEQAKKLKALEDSKKGPAVPEPSAPKPDDQKVAQPQKPVEAPALGDSLNPPSLVEDFVKYCQEFPKMNEDEIKETIHIFWKRSPEIEPVLVTTIKFLFRNRAEVFSSVYPGDSSQLQLQLEMPTTQRFMHKWLSFICNELELYPEMVVRDGLTRAEKIAEDRQWAKTVARSLDRTLSRLLDVGRILKDVENHELMQATLARQQALQAAPSPADAVANLPAVPAVVQAQAAAAEASAAEKKGSGDSSPASPSSPKSQLSDLDELLDEKKRDDCMLACMTRPLIGGLIAAAVVYFYYYYSSGMDMRAMMMATTDHSCMWDNPMFKAGLAGLAVMLVLHIMKEETPAERLKASLDRLADYELMDTRS